MGQFREFVLRNVVQSRWFDRFILAVIIANCFTIAINSPLLPDGDPVKEFCYYSGR